jgi:hypothetical protein
MYRPNGKNAYNLNSDYRVLGIKLSLRIILKNYMQPARVRQEHIANGILLTELIPDPQDRHRSARRDKVHAEHDHVVPGDRPRCIVDAPPRVLDVFWISSGLNVCLTPLALRILWASDDCMSIRVLN